MPITETLQLSYRNLTETRLRTLMKGGLIQDKGIVFPCWFGRGLEGIR